MRLNEITLAAVAILAMSGVASAGGFENHDLTKVEAAVVAQFEDGTRSWTVPEDMTIACCGSERDQKVIVTLDRHTDEIGQENRTDKAYMKELDDTCAKHGCGIEEIDAGSAIARLIRIPNLGGGMKGTNIFVVKDGDRLKILSAAKSDEIATENARKTLDALKAPIIGG